MSSAVQSRAIVLDFSDEFKDTACLKASSSPVRSRLESWSKASEKFDADTLVSKLTSASERRNEFLESKRAVASRPSKADLVKQQKTFEAEQLAALISRKVEEALQRAEKFKNERAAKGKQMSISKVEDLRKEEEASIQFTREMNEKRHAEALERAQEAKNLISQKCSRMSACNKKEEVLERLQRQSEEMRSAQLKRHKRACDRAQDAKRARALTGARMAVPKFEAVNRVCAECAEREKLAQVERHAKAETRAKVAKDKVVAKSKRVIAKVEAAREQHFHSLEKSLEEKQSFLKQREAEAAERLQAIQSEKAEKAHRMSCHTSNSPFSPHSGILPPPPPPHSSAATATGTSSPSSPLVQANDSGVSLGHKVTTLRKDSATGSHVVSIVTAQDQTEGSQAFASYFQDNNNKKKTPALEDDEAAVMVEKEDAE